MFPKKTILLLALLLISGCINENPQLVNPPLVVETVNVRFFNLAADGNNRSLYFDAVPIASEQPFNSVSAAGRPPFDSVTVEILSGPNNNKTYQQPVKMRFGRMSNYIVLALPNMARRTALDTGFVNIDTMVYIQSTTLKPPDTNQCFIKFLNANPDTAANYSIKVGCPNGNNLFIDNEITNVNYLQSTGAQAIYEGSQVISIIKNTKGQPASAAQVIGIFEVTLERLEQYALIVNSLDEVYLFDELAETVPPQLLTPVSERTAAVRTVNLSPTPVSVESAAGGMLSNNILSSHISAYNTITTCDIMNLDRLYLQVDGGQIQDTAFMSFDIYKNYTLLAYNTGGGNRQLLAVGPVSERLVARPGYAIVRIVNLNYSLGGLTVSCGATTSGASSNGYISGQTLCSGLQLEECSEAVYVPVVAGGVVPLGVFKASQPAAYLFSGLGFLEPEKEYIIAIDALESGDSGPKISVIESGQADVGVSFALPAAYTQVVNMAQRSQPITLSNITAGDIINDGDLAPGDVLATFLPLGANTLTTDNTKLEFDLSGPAARNLLLITDKAAGGVDIFTLSGPALGADNSSFKFRFINVAADCPALDVYQIERADTGSIHTGIRLGESSAVNSYHRDKSYSFVFRDAQSGGNLLGVNDLLFTLFKNYSVIFGGRGPNGYRIVVLQEY